MVVDGTILTEVCHVVSEGAKDSGVVSSRLVSVCEGKDRYEV